MRWDDHGEEEFSSKIGSNFGSRTVDTSLCILCLLNLGQTKLIVRSLLPQCNEHVSYLEEVSIHWSQERVDHEDNEVIEFTPIEVILILGTIPKLAAGSN